MFAFQRDEEGRVMSYEREPVDTSAFPDRKSPPYLITG